MKNILASYIVFVLAFVGGTFLSLIVRDHKPGQHRHECHAERESRYFSLAEARQFLGETIVSRTVSPFPAGKASIDFAHRVGHDRYLLGVTWKGAKGSESRETRLIKRYELKKYFDF